MIFTGKDDGEAKREVWIGRGAPVSSWSEEVIWLIIRGVAGRRSNVLHDHLSRDTKDVYVLNPEKFGIIQGFSDDLDGAGHVIEA